MVRIPEFLSCGDTIGICSTARKVSEREVEATVGLLEKRDYRIVLGKTIGLSCNQFAGTDAERAEDLQRMLQDREIKAVLFARGGYGSVRVLDKVDFSSLKEHPKWLVGYSDATALLSHVYYSYNVASLHAIMPINISKETADSPCCTAMLDALEGKGVIFESESCLGAQDVSFEGEIVGGNLSVLYSLLGSNSFGDTKDRILFIEDLDEYLYHIDRMMQGLKRAGKLQGLRGLVVGSMSDMHDNSVPFGQTAYEIVASAVGDYDYPKVYGASIGHIPQKNFPIVIGSQTEVRQRGNKITICRK